MSSTQQCRARTADGDRCEHSAGEDGYCHQHDPDDPTADSAPSDVASGDAAGSDASDGEGSESGEQSSAGTENETAATAGLVEVRDTASRVAGDLVEREVDGVVEVRNNDGSWTAVVEVVERHAIPDTQDILGRYEFDFTDDATATDYRRVDRYRRGESDRDEF